MRTVPSEVARATTEKGTRGGVERRRKALYSTRATGGGRVVKRRGLLRAGLLAGSAAAAYPLLACGGKSGGSTSSNAAPTASGAGGSPAAASTQAPTRPTGTLKVAHASLGNDSFDGHFARAIANTVTFYPIYAQLTGQDIDRKAVPQVALAWETPDPLTWVFKLRPGVKDHQGNPVNAEFIIWNLKRFQAKAPTSGVGSRMESAFAVDELTVQIKTKLPFVVGASESAGFGEVRLLGMKAFESMGEDQFLKTPVGTGPFAFDSRTPGEFMKFKAFNEYFGGPPKVERLEYYIVPEQTTRIAQLKTGQVHLISAIAGTAVDELETNRSIRLKKIEDASWLILSPFDIRRDTSPLKDPRVMQAVNYAIDKEGIIKGVYRGRGKPAPFGFFSPITDGYVQDHQTWKYDVAKAKALLKEAGYEGGFTMSDMAVSELSQFPLAPALIEAINNNLRDVGIRAPLRNIEYGAYITAVQQGQLFSLTYLASNNLPDLSIGFPVWLQSGSPFSPFTIPELDEDIKAQSVEFDPGKRTAILQRIFRRVNNTPLLAFTVSPDSYLAYSEKMSDWPQPKATAYIQGMHHVSVRA